MQFMDSLLDSLKDLIMQCLRQNKIREEIKEIFNNPQTLRQKLGEYFHAYDTVKIKDYATAKTFFFAKQGLCLKATWP